MAKVNKLAKELYGPYYDHYIKHTGNFKGCTGKSTAIALKLIAEALENPGKPIAITEGRGNIPENAPGGFVDVVEKTIEKLGLKFMHINRASKTLVYKLYEESFTSEITIDLKVNVVTDEVANMLVKELESAVGRQDYIAVESLSKAIQRIK